MDITRLQQLAGVQQLNEVSRGEHIIFIEVSNMDAYEKWDHNKGLAQIYDDSGIHVHLRQENYFRRHIAKFEQAMGRSGQQAAAQ